MSDDLLLRVERLERRSRILFMLVAGCAIAAVAFVVISSHRIPERIAARSISVVGSAGKNTASLEATQDGFVGLFFRDLDGESRLGLLMTPSGKPTLSFFSGKTSRLNLGVVDGPQGEEFSLQLRDTAAKPIWQPDISNGYSP